MASTTRVAAAQDALLALLQAASGLSGVHIDLGAPATELKAEQLWIGETTGWGDTVAITGTTAAGSQREESFTMNVNIVVTQSTNTFKTVRDRAITLCQAVEGVLAANPTLSASVFSAAIGTKSLNDAWADSQRQALITLRVDCLAILA